MDSIALRGDTVSWPTPASTTRWPVFRRRSYDPLDTAAWFTSAAAHDDVWVAASEMAVHFLRPTAKTALRCVGRMLKPGRRQDIVEAHLYDGEVQLVGHGVGTFTVLPDLTMPEIPDA